MPTDIPKKDEWIGDRAAVQAHLAMIQAIVARLATASASSKTWCVALVGAVTSLSGATRQPAILSYVGVAVAIFWFLDVRYLAQEKAFRELFERLAAKIGKLDSYCLEDVFVIKAPTTGKHIADALLSWSTSPMYIAILAAYGIAWCRGWVNLLAAA